MILSRGFFEHFHAESTNAVVSEQIKEIYSGSTAIYADEWVDPNQTKTEQTDPEIAFFANFKKSDEFVTLEAQLSTLFLGLYEWCNTHGIKRAKDWLDFNQAIVIEHMNGTDIQTALSLYGAGKRSLEIIYIKCTNATGSKLDDYKALMQNFLKDGRLVLCKAGAYIGIINLSLELSNTLWPQLLLSFRSNYIRQLAIEFTHDLVYKADKQAEHGGELHYVNFLENYVNRYFDLPYKSDVHRSYKFSESACKAFAKKAQGGLGISIVEQICEYLLAVAQRAKNLEDCKAFASELQGLGGDDYFYLDDIFDVDTESGTTFTCKPNASFFIRCTVLKRFHNSKFFAGSETLLLFQQEVNGEIYVLIPAKIAWSWHMQITAGDKIAHSALFIPGIQRDFVAYEIDHLALLRNALEQQAYEVIEALLINYGFPARFKITSQATILHVAFYKQDFRLLQATLNAKFTLPSDWSNRDTRDLIAMAAKWQYDKLKCIFFEAFKNGNLNIPRWSEKDIKIIAEYLHIMLEAEILNLPELLAIILHQYLYLENYEHNPYLDQLMLKCVTAKLSEPVKLLAYVKANINASYTACESPEFIKSCLYVAVEQGHMPTICILLEYGADPFQTTKSSSPWINRNYENSAMHLALTESSPEIAKHMILKAQAASPEMLVEACKYYKSIAWLVLETIDNLTISFIGRCNTCSHNISMVCDLVLKKLHKKLAESSSDVDVPINAEQYIELLQIQLSHILHCNANNITPFVGLRLKLAELSVKCIISCDPTLSRHKLCDLGMYKDDIKAMCEHERFWDSAYASDISSMIVDSLDASKGYSWWNRFDLTHNAKHKLLELIVYALLRNWRKFASCNHERVAAELSPLIYSAISSKLGGGFLRNYWSRTALEKIETDLTATIQNCIATSQISTKPEIPSLLTLTAYHDFSFDQLKLKGFVKIR